jgi:hypothetical protein
MAHSGISVTWRLNSTDLPAYGDTWIRGGGVRSSQKNSGMGRDEPAVGLAARRLRLLIQLRIWRFGRWWFKLDWVVCQTDEA